MHLEIYVSCHCSNCDEALAIASEARDIPGIEVNVINLDNVNDSPPPGIVAVPTYRLDGRIVSLGNPDRRLFIDRLMHEGEETRE